MGVSFIRTIVLYIFVVVAVRLMGKRQIGELQPSELVVAILISELAAIPMQDFGIPITNGIIPILTLVAAEMIFSCIMLKSNRFRVIFAGRPSVIIKDGRINQKEMKKQRFTVDDLMEELRLLGIKDLSEVDTAIMETNGQLSVFKKAGNDPVTTSDLNIKIKEKYLPVPLIIDGKLLSGNLSKANLKGAEINDILKNERVNTEDVFFMYKNSDGEITTIKKDKA